MSAGCIPICTPSGAMAEKLGINRQMAQQKLQELIQVWKMDQNFRNLLNDVILKY